MLATMCCSSTPLRISVALLMLFMESRGVAQTPQSSSPQTIATSPDGKFSVRREQAESGEHGEARKSLEICSASGKVLYSWMGGLGATTALWSPDGHYLAINDMPGESGDLVRIFHLDPEKPAVIPLREPDGKKLLKEVEERHGTFFSTIEGVHFRAEEWREGRLWCLLAGQSHPKRQPAVHVPFHYLWVLGVQGAETPVLVEEWTRTDPKERSYRETSADRGQF